MKIISIDPGYERLGIAVIEKQPSFARTSAGKKEVLIFSECFKTSSKLPHHERLAMIGDKIKEIIKKYRPKVLATEKLFFSNNQKTALLVAEARGVILYTGSSLGLEIFEYTPVAIKIAVTGYGKSDKRQVINMVEKLIDMGGKKNNKKTTGKSDDEYDAIAIGLTHFATHK